MKFRKKPLVIEAIQLSRNFFELAKTFLPKEVIGNYNCGEFLEDECYIEIKTLEGTMTAKEDDWIIKGVGSEFYPCKDVIFRATYESVDDEDK